MKKEKKLTKVKKIEIYIRDHFPSGKFTPKQLVDAARPKSSPIHSCFNWDDASAAEQWRLEQARSFIREITITIGGRDNIRAFHNVEDVAGHTYYVSTERAMNDEDLWHQVIENALAELIIWKKRYSTYKELAPVHRAIDKTLIKIRKDVK